MASDYRPPAAESVEVHSRREPQRVLLVDDHALFREGLAGLFAYEEDFEVVGEAATGEEALAAARELMPDLILMDIDMPGMDGIEATRRLLAEMPYAKVVMLTVHDDDEKLFEAIKAGAQGYLVKSIRSAEMLDQLRGLSRGEAALSRAMAKRILDEFRRAAARPLAPAGGEKKSAPAEPLEPLEPAPLLTFREQEVLELVAQRCTNKEIAARLFISEYTVKNHLRNILSKLHLRSRIEAAAYARGLGRAAGSSAGLPHPWPAGSARRSR